MKLTATKESRTLELSEREMEILKDAWLILRGEWAQDIESIRWYRKRGLDTGAVACYAYKEEILEVLKRLHSIYYCDAPYEAPYEMKEEA